MIAVARPPIAATEARRIVRASGRGAAAAIAGVPERQEPDIGEINHPYLFTLLDDLGYDGWVGCEYRPRGQTEAGLGWLAAVASPAA